MSEMTAQRASTLAWRWVWAAISLVPVMLALGLVGFTELHMPLTLIGTMCLVKAAHLVGWSQGCQAAEKKFAHTVRCNELAPDIFLGVGDHDHRCVLPALDCDPKRGRPEHKCHCGTSWIVGVPEGSVDEH